MAISVAMFLVDIAVGLLEWAHKSNSKGAAAKRRMARSLESEAADLDVLAIQQAQLSTKLKEAE